MLELLRGGDDARQTLCPGGAVLLLFQRPYLTGVLFKASPPGPDSPGRLRTLHVGAEVFGAVLAEGVDDAFELGAVAVGDRDGDGERGGDEADGAAEPARNRFACFRRGEDFKR